MSKPILDPSKTYSTFALIAGFITFAAFNLRLEMSGIVLWVRRAAVYFMLNFLAAFVPKYSIHLLFAAKVTAATMGHLFLAAQHLRHHRYIMWTLAAVVLSVCTNPMSLSMPMCAL